MNSTRQTLIDEEASLWAARIEGSTLTAADRAALDTWLAADVSHRAALSGYCQFSADLEEQLPALVATGAITMPEAPARSRGWRFTWIAGTALAAAAIALMLWLRVGAGESFATLTAQRQTIALADGTQIELNARTTLVATLGRHERHVRLTEGEAFFQVAKDKSRPFIVDTPTGSVRVTGTQFDVRTEGTNQFDVAVREGSVEVRPGDFSGPEAANVRPLGAGDVLSARTSGVSVRPISVAGVEELLAWRQGRIVCEGMPLRDVLARFGHYHGRVMTASPAAENLSVGGTYSLEDLSGFLNALPDVFPAPLRVITAADGTIRVSLRSER
jgi:transmembrane sensor